MTPRDNELLAELLLRWEELHEQGQDMPASQLAKAHPQLIEELTYRIQALKGISWIDDPLEDDPPDDLPDDPPHAPRTLAGRYRLDELIAETPADVKELADVKQFRAQVATAAAAKGNK